MTRDEARILISSLIEWYTEDIAERLGLSMGKETYMDALEVLWHGPEGELISRADAIEAVKETKPIVRSTECNWGKMIAEQHSKELVKALNALPSAEAIDLNESCEKCEHHLKGANEVPCCYCTIGKSFYTPTEATCETCADRAMCIMSAPDGKWKACKDYRPSAEAVQLRQTDTLIIAGALRYLAEDTERHPSDRTRAEELRKQFLQYGASMCHSADGTRRKEP